MHYLLTGLATFIGSFLGVVIYFQLMKRGVFDISRVVHYSVHTDGAVFSHAEHPKDAK